MQTSNKWIDQKIMYQFLDSLNDYFKKQNKKASIYIFGGGALCLHGLREKTSDFDSCTLIDGETDFSKAFDDIKNQCLPAIGVKSYDQRFNDTFNDMINPIFSEDRFSIFNIWLDKTKEEFQFDLIAKYTHLNVIIPPKEYLLIYRLVDLKHINPKTEQDKMDCISLLKDLNITKENKHAFFEKFSNHPKIEYIKETLSDDSIFFKEENKLETEKGFKPIQFKCR